MTSPQKTACFRTERIILINQNWYFQVRDSQPIGPFDCLENVRKAMKAYLEMVAPPRPLSDGQGVKFTSETAGLHSRTQSHYAHIAS